jgi:hypothetical protein
MRVANPKMDPNIGWAQADARSCFGAEMIPTVSGEERKGGCNSKKV